MKLKIQSDSPNAHSTRVWLDGHEISNVCTSITLQISVGKATTATIAIIPRELDIDANTLALLKGLDTEVSSEQM